MPSNVLPAWEDTTETAPLPTWENTSELPAWEDTKPDLSTVKLSASDQADYASMAAGRGKAEDGMANTTGFTAAMAQAGRHGFPEVQQFVADKLKVDPQTVADATDAVMGGAAGLGAILSGEDPVNTFAKVAGQRQRTPSTAEATFAGSQNSVAEGISFFASPLGAATLGLGAAPAAVQKAAAAAFVATMAHQAPEQLQSFYEAKYNGDVAGMAKSITDMGLDAAMITGGAIEGTHMLDRAAGRAAEWMRNRPITPEVVNEPEVVSAKPDDVVDVQEVPRELAAGQQPKLLNAPTWEETTAEPLETVAPKAEEPPAVPRPLAPGYEQQPNGDVGPNAESVGEETEPSETKPPANETPAPLPPPKEEATAPIPPVPPPAEILPPPVQTPVPEPVAKEPVPPEPTPEAASLPVGAVDLRPAVKELAEAILKGPLDKKTAAEILSRTYGGTMAAGKFDSKDMGDAIEMAMNQVMLRFPDAYARTDVPADEAARIVGRIKELTERLPTQTTRTAEQDKLQQFSTVPSEAYLANWVANLKPNDAVLEPSAGVGGLAVFAKAAGAHVIANELSDRRADLLGQTGIADQISRHNAEHLNAQLTPAIEAKAVRQPTAVVMNPPFSNAANVSTSNTFVGAKHVEEALKLLPQGGRLVAIVGSGMAENMARFKPWWKQMKAKYNVRANIQVSGKEYTKYGTSFDNQIVVIDKSGPTPESGTVGGRVEKVEELIPLLERIRNERPTLEPTESTPAEPGGAQPPAGGGERPGPRPNAPAEPGAPGQPGPGGRTPGTRRPGGKGAGGLGTPGQRPAGGGAGGTGKQPDAGLGGAGKSGSDHGPGGEHPPGSEQPAPKLKEQAKDEGLTVEQLEKGQRKLSDLGVFSEYSPQKVRIAGASPHPTPLVESTAMASVEPVDPTYRPSMPKEMIAKGGLSDAQLENVVYAGQAHGKLLKNGQRMGYFIGDGTGVGKGRQIAAIIMDNWNKGRRKAVWVSTKGGLLADAKRDLGDLGFDTAKVIDFWKNSGKNLIGAGDGVAFVPYSSLKSGNPGLKETGELHPPEIKQGVAKPARIHMLHQWVGKDFDGVIVFDESHLAGNAIDIKGKRGVKKASEQGMMVLDVQKLFPNARIVYSSATGATDITNLSYADRLGIWGEGTPFSTKEKFFEQIRAGGLSAMEIVARDMKSMGRYLARTLSFEGVDHRQLVHKLSQEQRGIYDQMAQAWQYVLRHRDETMAATNAAKDGQARSKANSAFYGAQQRFYNQLLTAMQMPSIINDIKAERAKNNSVVLQLVNTDEAAQNRQIAAKAGEAEDGDNYLEDLDLSPKDILLQYIDTSYPTTLYEPYQDDNGNTKYRPVRDANGNPVKDPEALRRKQQLMDRIALLNAPSSPIGMILDTFGADKVAEITGRSQRVVLKEQEDGTMKRVLEKNRSDAKRKVEAQEFQDGKRHILIFSDAGGTGYSYHASRRAINQQRRVHYLVQAGWRADAAMQGFGRTHRSDQAHAPEYVLPSTDIKGHQRFISTIARRLSELGALTGGERKSAGGEMFNENSNLENDYAEDGVEKLFRDAFGGGKIAGMGFDELCRKLGYTKLEVDEQTGEIKERNLMVNPHDGSLVQDKIPSIQQFLNRILSLEVNDQNATFDGFIERMTQRIEAAKADGSYDPGTQTLKALSIRKLRDESVYKDPDSTAETRLVSIEHDHPQKLIHWEDLNRGQPVAGYAANIRSGRLFALKEGPVRTSEAGGLVPTYYRMWVNGYDLVPKADVSGDNYRRLDPPEAQQLWQQQTAALPKVLTQKDTYVVGTFLPIWDRLKIPNPKIWRIRTDKGENLLGAHVPAKMVAGLRSRLGAGLGERRSPEEVFRGVLENGESVELANGWKLMRKRVGGESRIEIMGVPYGEENTVTQLGGYMERIAWTPRYFLPTDETAGIAAMGKLLEKSPEAGGTVEHGMASSRKPKTKAQMPPMPEGPPPAVPVTAADLAKPANDFMKDVNRFRSVVAPQTMGEPARFAANLLRMLNAELANEEARADEALRPFRNSFDRTPLPKGWKYDPTLPLPRNLAFIAAYEGGNAAVLGPTEAAAAAEFARQNEAWLEQVHALETGALHNVIENYFPHLWDDSERAKKVIAASLARRPLQGSKSFLKQRTHELFLDGLAAGLLPVHDNPVDLWMLKRREVGRYILGVKFCKQMKAAGLLKFVHAFRQAPEGWSTANDRAFQVYGPPTVTIKEAFDAGMREATDDVLRSLGVPEERLAKIGGGRWGYETHQQGVQGKERIVTKFGGPEWVRWHELGHVLDNRYPDLRPTMTATDQMQDELRKLADLRYEGEKPSDHFKRYVRSMPEKMAVILQAYLHAPDRMEQVAPSLKQAFAGFLKAHPELDKINDIRPGLRLGEAETEQAVNGLVKLGNYYMPDSAARVVNNYLSPGLNPHLWYRTLKTSSNLLNGIQLGMSAFHLGFTSLDAAVSRLAVGIEDAVHGRVLSAARTIASVPVSPLTNIMAGARLRSAVLADITTGELAPLVKALEAGGGRIGQDKFWQTEFTRRMLRAFHQGTATGLATGALNAPLALVEQMMRPIMEYVVPRQKLGVFADMAKRDLLALGPDPTPEDVREAMRKVWNSVDNRMGQVVYDNLFYNRSMKDVLLLSMRAYGWQLGKYQEGLGAIADTAEAARRGARGERPEFTHRMAYVMALPILVGILGGVVTYLATGRRPQGKDYFMPPIGGTDQNGNPLRVNFPSYVKDVMAYAKHPATSFGHSLNPLGSAMMDLLMNRNFYDVRIRNPDDPIWKQGSEVAQWAGQQLVPFSVSGAMNLHQNATPAWQQVAPFFGITPASSRMSMTPAQELAAEITAAAMPTEPRTQASYDRGQLIKQVVRDLKTGKQPQAVAELRGGLQAGILNESAAQTLVERLQYTPLQFQVHHMTPDAAMHVWRVASPEEQTQLKPIIVSKIANAKSLDPQQAAAYVRELAK